MKLKKNQEKGKKDSQLDLKSKRKMLSVNFLKEVEERHRLLREKTKKRNRRKRKKLTWKEEIGRRGKKRISKK